MINLYGYLSSRSNRPHWALEEIGIEYRFYQIDFEKNDNESDFYLSINPNGKVPALVDNDNDLVLLESGAICNYLGTRFSESGLLPNFSISERALYDQWMMFVLTELEQPLWTKGKHWFVLPAEYRIPQIFKTLPHEFKKSIDMLHQHLKERKYMIGNRFTIIDIFVAHTLRWAKNFNFSLEHPKLEEYLEEQETRSAYARMQNCPKLTISRS